MKAESLITELRFRTSRSSGKGGQNVNKVSTRVELLFDVESSRILADEQKSLILVRLRHRIKSDGCIHVVSQAGRSQFANKTRAIERFLELIRSALKVEKKRKPTGVSRQEKEKRLHDKKSKGQIKESRRRPDPES